MNTGPGPKPFAYFFQTQFVWQMCGLPAEGARGACWSDMHAEWAERCENMFDRLQDWKDFAWGLVEDKDAPPQNEGSEFGYPEHRVGFTGQGRGWSTSSPGPRGRFAGSRCSSGSVRAWPTMLVPYAREVPQGRPVLCQRVVSWSER